MDQPRPRTTGKSSREAHPVDVAATVRSQAESSCGSQNDAAAHNPAFPSRDLTVAATRTPGHAAESYRLVRLRNGTQSVHALDFGETMHPGLGPAAEAEAL